jgi:phage terminase large subunit-like protein
MPAVRIGSARVCITTTPRPVRLLRELLNRDDGSVVVSRGSTWDNEANLSSQALAELRRRYHGTRIGRQELEGHLPDDVEGALWTRDLIEPYRVERVKRDQLVRVVVAVNPAVTSGEDSDDTGCVVCGVDGDGNAYVLADETCHLSPDKWARRVVHAYERWRADRIIAETNNGGQLVEAMLRTVDASLPISLVHASIGKRPRAEPVSAYYEQHRVHHAGVFVELEDQLCTWVPGMASPDRLDALVWALTELKPGGANAHAPVWGEQPGPSASACLRPALAYGMQGGLGGMY